MKKGFTLIELLAVIVILAIIALIATPIVLNIIAKARENSDLRSGEMYLDAVKMAVANSSLEDNIIPDGTYDILEDGDLCLEQGETTCARRLEVEVDGDTPKEGTITILNEQISEVSFKYNQKTIEKNEKGKLVYQDGSELTKLDKVCEYQNNGVAEKTAGAKYKCKVDPNKDPYTFYVLTTPTSNDKTINLIMDQNIYSDGTPAEATRVPIGDNASKYNLVVWVNNTDYYKDVNGVIPDDILNDNDSCTYISACGFNDKGPITAMNFLKEATKTWTNTNEMTIDSFNYEDGTTKPMNSIKTYARMPIYMADATKTEVAAKTTSNEYLYENLDSTGNSDLQGYWTMTAQLNDTPKQAYYVGCNGKISYELVSNDFSQYNYYYGIRPVINLNL